MRISDRPSLCFLTFILCLGVAGCLAPAGQTTPYPPADCPPGLDIEAVNDDEGTQPGAKIVTYENLTNSQQSDFDEARPYGSTGLQGGVGEWGSIDYVEKHGRLYKVLISVC